MSAGFTPGPWKVSARRCSYIGVESTIAAGCQGGNQSVTRCVVTNNSLRREQAEANAALIAAAPELYAAAERLIAKADHPNRYLTEADCNELRAALAKARGEQ